MVERGRKMERVFAEFLVIRIHTRFAAIFILAALAFLLAGCADANHVVATLGSSSKPYQEYLEDPVALTTIKTIAVFPFANRAPQPGFDAEVFANKLATQLANYGKVRVIYPWDILGPIERENRDARRYNAQLREKMSLGLHLSDKPAGQREEDIFSEGGEELRPRQYFNPIDNVDEAVRLARKVKADAIIVGEVSDFDPYMRPRLTLTLRLIATGNSETSARAIAELTQWGVPLATGKAKGVIYVRQEAFDSRVGSVGLDVSKYGRTHLIADHPYGTEVYLRSMTYYYDVVAHQLASSYMEARKKAVKEAEDRARAAAKNQKRDQDEAARRMYALMERDARIPDYETDARGQEWFDQSFPDRQALLGSNGGDRRIQSWRPEGRTIRPATTDERLARDGRVPENERGRGLEGYSTMTDAAFPDADSMMEMNLGDNRDRSWRPDYYNHANPQKSAPLYQK